MVNFDAVFKSRIDMKPCSCKRCLNPLADLVPRDPNLGGSKFARTPEYDISNAPLSGDFFGGNLTIL